MSIKRRTERSRPPHRGTAHERLKSALATMTETVLHQPVRLTVSELCRLAGVSRNTLYRYHAPILAALRHRQRPRSARSRARRAAEQRRRENVTLRARVAQLAALVDHYFSAYREATTLLERRDRELAELRSKKPAKLAIVSFNRGPSASLRPGPEVD